MMFYMDLWEKDNWVRKSKSYKVLSDSEHVKRPVERMRKVYLYENKYWLVRNQTVWSVSFQTNYGG